MLISAKELGAPSVIVLPLDHLNNRLLLCFLSVDLPGTQ